MLGLAAVDWAGDFEQDSAKPGLTQNHREASSGGREVLTPLKAAGKPWAAVMSLGEKKKKMAVGRHRCREELRGSGSLCGEESLAGEDLAAPS